MKKMTKSVIAAAVLAATSSVAMAEVSMNIGATSNYLWRGVTQSADLSAVSGGVDYANESGIYAGTWTSSLASGDYELDLYAGYAGQANDLGYDVGVISYRYPVSDTYFNEVYLNGSFDMFNAGVAYTFGSDNDNTATFSSGDLYIHASVETEVSEGITLGATVGSYNYSDTLADDYTHFAVSVSKADFTIALEKNSMTDTGAGEDNPRVAVSWGQSF